MKLRGIASHVRYKLIVLMVNGFGWHILRSILTNWNIPRRQPRWVRGLLILSVETDERARNSKGAHYVYQEGKTQYLAKISGELSCIIWL